MSTLNTQEVIERRMPYRRAGPGRFSDAKSEQYADSFRSRSRICFPKRYGSG